MKLLYGVQGTGNGHITRARCLAKAFEQHDVQVDYLFSGRSLDQYFAMEGFTSRRFFQGFTFATTNNKIDRIGTLRKLKPIRFIKDVRDVPVNAYDLVLTDYEPITAWAARVKGAPVLGIGHQYAFHSKAPKPRADIAGRMLLRYFAPARNAFGVHWHHFNGNILPPIIDTELTRAKSPGSHYVVYLPFDDPLRLVTMLKQLPNKKFIVYTPHVSVCSRQANVTLRKTQQAAFKDDLRCAAGVITSCGFGLVSEALHIGLPLLAVPVAGQIEQQANADALALLGLASTASKLSVENLQTFTENAAPTRPQHYPNVADALAQYIVDGRWDEGSALVDSLWKRVNNLPNASGSSLTTSFS